jgi:hypothetical protein
MDLKLKTKKHRTQLAIDRLIDYIWEVGASDGPEFDEDKLPCMQEVSDELNALKDAYVEWKMFNEKDYVNP